MNSMSEIEKQTQIQAECPHCSFRFFDPEGPLRVGQELWCPQCNGVVRVCSLHPPEFDYPEREYSLLDSQALLRAGAREEGCRLQAISWIANRARKQGLQEIILDISFEEPSMTWVTIEVISAR